MEAKDDVTDGPCQPETLVQGLRCPVCLEYFTQPHTLACGHSFCLKCLRTLAKITRISRSRAPLERLRLRCPSCRKMTRAATILRRRAAVNYALKELVNEWFNSPYARGSVEYITLRSIACQTGEETSPANRSLLNLKAEDIKEDDEDGKEIKIDISESEFRRILFHKIQRKSDLLNATDDIANDSTDLNTPSTADESGASDENNTSSSSEDESEQEVVPLLADLQVVNDGPLPQIRRGLDIFHVMSVSTVVRIFFAELAVLWRGVVGSRSRLALTIFWFIYGGLVVCVSRSFFPWMALYTLIYFIIMYADISNPAYF